MQMHIKSHLQAAWRGSVVCLLVKNMGVTASVAYWTSTLTSSKVTESFKACQPGWSFTLIHLALVYTAVHTDAHCSLMQVDPIKGNVAFGACQSGWSFTLLSFAQLYCDVYGAAMDPKEFARRLWGDIYFQPTTRKFKKTAPEKSSERTFVEYILTPLYKIYSQVWVIGCSGLMLKWIFRHCLRVHV